MTDSQIDQYTYRDDFIDSIELIVDRGERLLEVEEVEINSKDRSGPRILDSAISDFPRFTQPS